MSVRVRSQACAAASSSSIFPPPPSVAITDSVGDEVTNLRGERRNDVGLLSAELSEQVAVDNTSSS